MKRPNLSDKAKEQMQKLQESQNPQPSEAERKSRGISLPADLDGLIRDVSFKRAKETGKRASVSGIVEEALQRMRTELEEELNG